MFKNKDGFTLIELIIVMAIIGILSVVGIVAISGKTQDARNAKRKADIASVLTVMSLYCAESVMPIECGNDGTNKNVLANCQNPGSYINLKTVLDPSTAGLTSSDRCDTINGKCNYTISLTPGAETYNQCDPKILFSLEDGIGWKSACARNTGIEFNIDQRQFDSCR